MRMSLRKEPAAKKCSGFFLYEFKSVFYQSTATITEVALTTA